MNPVYIVKALRSPIGKYRGSLAGTRPDDLMALVIKELYGKSSFPIDDVIVGCSNQAGEDNRNIARMALLLAGLPYEVPGATLNRLCGSSLDALTSAYSRIGMGLGHCMIVGGVESMSRAPYVLGKAQVAYDKAQPFYDTVLGWRFPNKKMQERFPLLSMGETAERVAKEYNISRVDQDAFALSSHQKACQAIENKAFDDEIVPIQIKEGNFSKDECPRQTTSLEKLSSLKPVFHQEGSVTAGNSSPLNDGAAAILVASEEFVKKHNLTPLAQITGASVIGRDPNTMGMGPVDAINKLKTLNGINPKDYDIYEINEAFAAQALACIRELDIDPAKVNQRGGSLAIGHPLGCSGARIVTTLVHQMKKDHTLKKGVASMCIGVGQGIALSIDNCLNSGLTN